MLVDDPQYIIFRDAEPIWPSRILCEFTYAFPLALLIEGALATPFGLLITVNLRRARTGPKLDGFPLKEQLAPFLRSIVGAGAKTTNLLHSFL